MVEDTAILDVLHVAQKRENVRPHYAVSIRKVPDKDLKPVLICCLPATEVVQAGQGCPLKKQSVPSVSIPVRSPVVQAESTAHVYLFTWVVKWKCCRRAVLVWYNTPITNSQVWLKSTCNCLFHAMQSLTTVAQLCYWSFTLVPCSNKSNGFQYPLSKGHANTACYQAYMSNAKI